MKVIALLFGLIAFALGAYDAVVAQDYATTESAWMRTDRSDPIHERLGDRRSDLRNLGQMLVVSSVPVALVGLLLGFLARKRQAGALPLVGLLGSCVGLLGAVFILTKDIF
jgi:hypothetical protein